MKQLKYMVLVLGILLLTACTATEDVSTVSDPEPEQAVQPATLGDGQFEPRPHRAAPAPPTAIVADSAEFFAATGNPQLVEIFTDW